jgi:predicted Zn-dependent protease
MKRKFKIGFILLACLILAGCASLGVYNAATERREFIFIPTDYEIKMGADFHQQITAQYNLSTRTADVERLERIGQKLAQVSDRQDYEYNFYLIEKDEINAFTTPGGSIYFFTGLYDKLKSDDEIASVLAHEIGHCAARHVIKKFQAAMGYNLLGGLIIGQLAKEEMARRVATMGSNTAMSLVFSAYGRRDEYEADRLGLKYMDLTGYKLEAMVTTFEVLEKESKGPRMPVFFQTHPYVKDRITAVKKEIERIQAESVRVVSQ